MRGETTVAGGLESGRIALRSADSLGTWKLTAKVMGQHGCPCAEID